jgi:hypothetical protein
MADLAQLMAGLQQLRDSLQATQAEVIAQRTVSAATQVELTAQKDLLEQSRMGSGELANMLAKNQQALITAQQTVMQATQAAQASRRSDNAVDFRLLTKPTPFRAREKWEEFRGQVRSYLLFLNRNSFGDELDAAQASKVE